MKNRDIIAISEDISIFVTKFIKFGPSFMIPDKKSFSEFAETLHTWISYNIIFFYFEVARENSLMRLKLDFKFEICKSP